MNLHRICAQAAIENMGETKMHGTAFIMKDYFTLWECAKLAI